jgi:ribosomal protein S18 acetylase RimI-like enzyme
MDHALDNPVWHALHGRQAGFGEVNALAARYLPAFSPIAALREPTRDAVEALADLCGADPAVVLTLAPQLPAIPRLRVMRSVALRQMACDVAPSPVPLDAMPVGTADTDEVLALVALTQPGPFAQRTLELGNYLGVRRGGRLLAMTGERVMLPGWTEVSGVCTHPDGRGEGYALALVIAVTNAIFARGERAFLHVALGSPSEMTATRVYERAGFYTRREIYIHALAPV